MVTYICILYCCLGNLSLEWEISVCWDIQNGLPEVGGSGHCTVHLIVVWLSWCHYVWTWGLHRQGKCIERLVGLFVATWKVPRRGFLGTENLTEPCLCWHNLLGQVRLEWDGCGPVVFIRVEQIYFIVRGHAKKNLK